MRVEPWISQVRKGVVEYVVLLVLANGEAYGYELLQKLASVKQFALGESTIYPLLNRLAQDGFVSVRKVNSENGPPRRYYRLTASGRERLDAMHVCWKEMSESIEEMKGDKP
jgi:PadR family transcriptional regulator PadR